MSFEPIRVTNKGRQLLAKAVAGGTLTFTRLKMGDGQITSQVIETMADVIHEIISLKPNEPTIGDKYTSITGNFRNAAVEDLFIGDGLTTVFKLSAAPTSLISVNVNGVKVNAYTYALGSVTFATAPVQDAEIKITYNLEGFYWREAAIFALDPDDGEIMFAYQNANSLAEYIKSASSGIIEKVIGASFVISSDVKVEVSVDESLVLMPLSKGQYKTEILPEDNSVNGRDLIPVYKMDGQKNVKTTLDTLTNFLEYEIGISEINLNLSGKENKAKYEESVMLASKWNKNTSTYSFEDTWPANQYDLEIGPSDGATAEQIQAYGAALIPINGSNNVATAKGDVPEIDIPIIVKVVER